MIGIHVLREEEDEEVKKQDQEEQQEQEEQVDQEEHEEQKDQEEQEDQEAKEEEEEEACKETKKPYKVNDAQGDNRTLAGYSNCHWLTVQFQAGKQKKCAAVFTLNQLKLGNPTYEAGTLAFRVPARMQANPV